MNPKKSDRLMTKCLDIYNRRKWLYPVHQFLERLESKEDFDGKLSTVFWEESLIPEIKKRHFSHLTIDTLLKNSLALYRSETDRDLGLQIVWERIEWKYPFTQDAYTEFVERFDKLLASEPIPPTKSDWDHLDEHILK